MLHPTCKECQRVYSRQHYQRHKKRYIEQKRQRLVVYRKKLREFIDTTKQHPCMDCKLCYPTYVMDFDHVRGKKIFDISNAVRTNKALTQIKTEIEKCDLVCANCHRVRTYNR